MDLRFSIDPDDVLAQPTRARLFAMLAELGRPAATAELADRVELHPNGVRVHLEGLENAGLVARSREARPKGRPRHVWTIAPDARPGGDPPSAYANLGRWLARAIPARTDRLRDVEAAGREIGRELATRDALDGGQAMQTALASLGFQPRKERGRAGRLTYRLRNCPYRDAVRENQAVVCTLHRGVTRGLLDILDPTMKLAGFVPRDPDTAGCLIEVVEDDAAATA